MKRILTGLIVAAMVLAACGGSSKKSNAGNSSTGSNTNADSSSSGSSDLTKLAGEYAKAKIKITYSFTGSGSSETLTLAQDGNGKSSFSTGSSTFYTDASKSVACEGTGTSETCTQLGTTGLGSAALGGTFSASFAAISKLLTSLGTGHKSSETIAGRDATCVTYKASEVIGKLGSLVKGSNTSTSDYSPNDTAIICIDKKTGFMLKLNTTKKGAPDTSMEATSVGDPSDSDFTPPVTPQTIPNISGLTPTSAP